MDPVSLIGWFATMASAASFTPQAWKVIRTAETKDLSFGMYLITVIGFSLWTVYGVLLGAWPLIVTNTICLSLSGFILVMKILPRRKKRAVAAALNPDADSPAP